MHCCCLSLYCLMFVLLSVRRAAILDLHYFPTRRSSDLLASFGPRGSGRAVPGGGGHSTSQVSAPVRRCSPAAARVSGMPRADRKSTRLNSSHVKISYAVFCLKKKKEA